MEPGGPRELGKSALGGSETVLGSSWFGSLVVLWFGFAWLIVLGSSWDRFGMLLGVFRSFGGHFCAFWGLSSGFRGRLGASLIVNLPFFPSSLLYFYSPTYSLFLPFFPSSPLPFYNSIAL